VEPVKPNIVKGKSSPHFPRSMLTAQQNNEVKVHMLDLGSQIIMALVSTARGSKTSFKKMEDATFCHCLICV
jgi:hypothetical protein